MSVRAPLLLLFALLVVVGSTPVATAKAELRPFAKDTPEFVKLLEEVADEISGQNVYDCIEEITTDPLSLYRVMGSPTQHIFIDNHANVFTEVSPRIKSQVVHFDEGGAGVGGGAALPGGGNNIIGVLPGKQLEKWVVLGGHYDTREATIGGAAIDNTSGICTVKEIARAVTALDLQPEATMVFAWWDGEEWGLYGARAFVKDHNATKELLGLPKDADVEILMGHSFDIVGINYPAMNTWVRYGDPTNVLEPAVLNLRLPPWTEENMTLCPSYGCYTKLREREDFESEIAPRFQNFSALVKEINYGLFGLPPEWVQAWDDKYGRSDHVPFTAAGIPGLRIQGSHDGEWPHYHQPTDTLPAAASMAGGVDNLVAGFNQAADSGGLVAVYIALKAELGTYAVPGPGLALDALPVAEGAEVPAVAGFEVVLAALGVGGLAWSIRRK